MSWKEKRLITILSIILAVLCAAVLLVLSVRYRTAQAAKAENSQTSASDIAQAAQSDYITPVSYTHLASAALGCAGFRVRTGLRLHGRGVDVYKRQIHSSAELSRYGGMGRK